MPAFKQNVARTFALRCAVQYIHAGNPGRVPTTELVQGLARAEVLTILLANVAISVVARLFAHLAWFTTLRKAQKRGVLICAGFECMARPHAPVPARKELVAYV